MNAHTRNLTAQITPPARTVTRHTVVLDYGLLAQARMAPYALGFFGIGLPIFLWVAKYSLTAWHISGYLLLFIIGWTAFMVLKNQVDRGRRADTDTAPPASVHRDLIRARLWYQGIAGGIWAVNLLTISLTASLVGPQAEMFLMICAGAAAAIIFFCAPVLLHLLIIAPLAMAGPILAMQGLDHDPQLSQIMTSGLALALAMGFMLNRHMQEHYLLEHRQLEMAREREAARADSDALNEAKMALMETLSREVQTGLKGIEQSLLQGLTHLTRAPAPRSHVDAALTEIGHLQSILITTLDNDTAESGQIELDMQPLDIDLICRRMTAQFAGLAHNKGLSFTYNALGLPDAGAAVGDEHRVEQVLAHLLSNALLYTQTGRVDLKLLLQPEGLLRLEVVDSGPGLREDELEQAFTPHMRIARTSSGHSGAGLGLSLSRSLAEMMGGRMGAQSTLDVGSKFWLDLSFDPLAAPPVRETAAEDLAGEPTEHTSLRVLLVANDSLRAAQLRDTLETLGHKCLTSTTRERAMTLAKKAPIDACLISTGAFEDVSDEANRAKLEAFLETLRATQTDAQLNILALLPVGDQADALQALGIKPLLMPQSRESLGRALTQISL